MCAISSRENDTCMSRQLNCHSAPISKPVRQRFDGEWAQYQIEKMTTDIRVFIPGMSCCTKQYPHLVIRRCCETNHKYSPHLHGSGPALFRHCRNVLRIQRIKPDCVNVECFRNIRGHLWVNHGGHGLLSRNLATEGRGHLLRAEKSLQFVLSNVENFLVVTDMGRKS